MKPLFDPSLISLDNAAEDFWQEYKRKQGLPVPSMGKQGVSGERATGEQESGDASAKAKYPTRVDAAAPVDSGHGCKPRAMTSPSDSLWSDAHMRFHFPKQFPARESESEADRLFIESGNKLIAAHRAKKKRFSLAGVFGFLVLVVMVGALTWLFVEGW